MPPITALLHTYNDAFRLGRCLETLYPCDEIVVCDRGSTDRTVAVAREYGARVIVEPDSTAMPPLASLSASHSAWILGLDPRESLSEALAASLYEWKLLSASGEAFSVFVREETSSGWIAHPSAQTRLVPPTWKAWDKTLPAHDGSAIALEGELLQFSLP